MGYHSDIQSRREKRLSEIRKFNKTSYQSRDDESGYQFEASIKAKFVMKSIISIFLLIGTYFLFQFNHPYAVQTQNVIKEALTREFNFTGLYDKYLEKFAGNPAILPTFSIKEKNNSNYNFSSPITTSPKKTSVESNGIYIETNQFEPVEAIGKGIIQKVSKNQENGQTITILHENGLISIYALLSQIEVEENDWVEKGQLIGMAKEKFFFAIKNQNKYLNPMEVIKF